MKKKGKFIVFLILIIFIVDIAIAINYSYALSKYGSRGSEVTSIQTKLKRWGYYNGAIDGVFGSQTLKAVKSFQQKIYCCYYFFFLNYIFFLFFFF